MKLWHAVAVLVALLVIASLVLLLHPASPAYLHPVHVHTRHRP